MPNAACKRDRYEQENTQHCASDYVVTLQAKMMGKRASEAAELRGAAQCRQSPRPSQLIAFGTRFLSWHLHAPLRALLPCIIGSEHYLPSGQVFVAETGLAGQLTPEQFLQEREGMLDSMFPQSQLMPGEPAIAGASWRVLDQLPAYVGCQCWSLSDSGPLPKLLVQLLGLALQRALHECGRSHRGRRIRRTPFRSPAIGKPALDIFQRAAAQFSPMAQPESCLVFEDAVTGVAAAKAADM